MEVRLEELVLKACGGLFDSTMNTLLTQYSLEKCLQVFCSSVQGMPREDSEVRPDSFIMDYIQTLDIYTSIHRNREGKERDPPDILPVK